MASPSADHAAGFSDLGHEYRVDILHALIDARREPSSSSGLSFSELRERAGIDDSGQFNYHLDALRERFVVERDGEYHLTYSGDRVCCAVLSGSYQHSHARGPDPVDHRCPRHECSCQVAVVYDDGYLTIECTAGHELLQTGLPPGAVADRSPEDVLQIAHEHVQSHVTHLQQATCFKCFGHVNFTAPNANDLESESSYASYEGTCDRCGTEYSAPALLLASQHPAVIDFCWKYDRNIMDTAVWLLPTVLDDIQVTAPHDDSHAVNVAITIETDTLELSLDDSGTISSVSTPRQ